MDREASRILHLAVSMSERRRIGQRVSGSGSADDRLRDILAEIGGAILPRDIELSVQDSRCVITANSGRVIRIDIDHEDRFLRVSREERLQRSAGILHRFAQTRGKLTIWSRPLREAPAEEEIGLTHGELRDHYRVCHILCDHEEGPFGEDETDFADALRAAASASAVFPGDNGAAACRDDAQALATPENLRAIAAEVTGWKGDALFDDACWIVGQSADAPSEAFGVVMNDDGVAFHAVPAGCLPDLARKWVRAQSQRDARQDA